MWHLFLIWHFINPPIPLESPFHKLPQPTSRLVIQKPNSFLKSLVGFLLVSWVLLSCVGLIVAGWIFLIFNGGSSNLLLFILLPFILFYGTVGGYIAIKIISRLGRIRASGLSDLIGVTPYGDQRASWLIAYLTYEQIGWIKIAHIIIKAIIAIVSFFWGLLIFIGVFGMLLDTLEITMRISGYSSGQLVTEIIRLASLMGIFYLNFIHTIVMGYLIGIWGKHFSTDGLSRALITIGAVLGGQLLLYLVAYGVLFVGLPNLYTTMGWATFFTLNALQVGGFMLLIETQVRILLRLLAYQAELPYAVWRLEVTISQK